MSRPLDELQNVVAMLITEHRKLLTEVVKHQAAIKAMDVPAMEASRVKQEALRVNISAIDHRRKLLANQIALTAKITGPTLTKLAEVDPQHRAKILAQRDELRSIAEQINLSSHVAGRVASSVLGHLNTVVRILAGAMQQAGVYTKYGVPKMAPRIGVIEAVG